MNRADEGLAIADIAFGLKVVIRKISRMW